MPGISLIYSSKTMLSATAAIIGAIVWLNFDSGINTL